MFALSFAFVSVRTEECEQCEGEECLQQNACLKIGGGLWRKRREQLR